MTTLADIANLDPWWRSCRPSRGRQQPLASQGYAFAQQQPRIVRCMVMGDLVPPRYGFKWSGALEVRRVTWEDLSPTR